VDASKNVQKKAHHIERPISQARPALGP